MAVLGHEADVVGRIPDKTGLKGSLPATVHEVRRSNRERGGRPDGSAPNAVAQIDIVDAAIDLERSPAAVIERVQHLDSAEAAAFVAAGLAGQIVTDFGIAGPE